MIITPKTGNRTRRLIQSPLLRYSLAIGATLLSFAATILLHTLTGFNTLAIFFAGITISSAYAGLIPGLLSTLLAVIFADIYVLPPYNVFSLTTQDAVILPVFFGVSLLINAVYNARARAEADSFLQQEAMRVTLLSIGDAVITTDTHGSITFMNPTAVALTGWSEAEAIGQPLMKIMNIVNAETRQSANDVIERVMAQQLTVGLANHTTLIARGGLEYTIEDSAAPIRDEKGQITGVVIVFHDATAKRAAEEAQEMLISVTEALIEVTNKQFDLPGFAAFFTRNFADWCELVILDDQDQPHTALIHHDPRQQPALEALYAHLPRAWNTGSQTMLRGQTISLFSMDTWIAAESTTAEDMARLTALNPGSQIYVPLQFNGRLFGVLGVSRVGGMMRRHFSGVDLSIMEDIGRRLSLALDGARLARETESARAQADRSAVRIAQLQQVTQALNRVLSPDDVAHSMVDQIVATFPDVYASVVGMVIPETNRIRILDQVGYDPELRARIVDIPIDDPDQAPSDVVRRGLSLFFHSYDEWLAQYPLGGVWVETKSLSLLVLRVEEKIIGYIAVVFSVPQPFPADDRALLMNLADQAAQALYRAQLFVAEQQARQQIDRIMDGMNDVFFSLDRDMRYTYLNRRAEANFDRPRDLIIGQRVQDILPDMESIRVFIEHVQRAHAENQPIRFEEYGPRRDEWFDVHIYPQPDGVTVFMEDITARRKAEAQARFSTDQLKRFVEAGVIGIVTSTDDGRIVQANDRFLEMVGYTRAELDANQMDWLRMTPPEWAEADQRLIAEGVTQGYSDGIEKEYYHKDGHRVPVLIGGIRTEGIWLLFVMDLTEQKRAENGLRLLTEASALLASLDDRASILDKIAALVVPRIADWCVIFMRQPDGNVRSEVITHRDPVKIDWARQLLQQYPPDMSEGSSFAGLFNSGRSSLIAEITEPMLMAAARGDAALLDTLHEIGYSSIMMVALRVQGEIVGFIQLVAAESRQRYTPIDLQLAEDLARRMSAALENAQLYSEVEIQRERLQVTLSSIGDAVIATDSRGAINFINAVAVRLTGWSAEDAIGRDLNQIFVLINEYSRQSVESPVTRVLREGVIVGLANHTLLIAKDGTEVPIDDSGAPIRDADGKLVGVVLVFRDIRERRIAERQLDETLERTVDLYNVSRQLGAADSPEEILSALLTSRYLEQTHQAAIITFDALWDNTPPSTYEVVATSNDRPLVGLATDHRLSDSPLLRQFSCSQAIFALNLAKDDRIDPAAKTALYDAGISSVGLFPLWTPEGCFGALIIYGSAVNTMTNGDFQSLRIFADQVGIVLESLRLFGAERSARQEAERANAIKLQFLAMISHELRTPLTSIKGFTSTLLATDVTWEAEAQREFIGIMDNEADKLGELINQLLDLSQLQAGTMRIHPTIETVAHVVEIASAQLTMLAHDHQLLVQIPPALPPVMVDARRISEVLTNLVGNATKYTPSGTTIGITAAQVDSMVRIGVADQGPGIPPENRNQIFEAFRQLERKGDEPIKGAGLGLAICKGLVEAHGGEIWVTDGEPDGAIFYFTIPIASP